MKHPTSMSVAMAAFLVLKAAGAQAAGLSEAEQQQMISNLIEADANADGALSLAEFEVLIKLNAADDLGRAAMLVRSGRYATAFSRLDANGDGFVTEAELQAMIRQVQG